MWHPTTRSLLFATSVLLVWLAGTPSVRAQAAGCLPDDVGTGSRYVILVHGITSASQTGQPPDTSDPNNHQVRDDFAPLHDALAAGLTPTPRFVYFSYG